MSADRETIPDELAKGMAAIDNFKQGKTSGGKEFRKTPRRAVRRGPPAPPPGSRNGEHSRVIDGRLCRSMKKASRLVRQKKRREAAGKDSFYRMTGGLGHMVLGPPTKKWTRRRLRLWDNLPDDHRQYRTHKALTAAAARQAIAEIREAHGLF